MAGLAGPIPVGSSARVTATVRLTSPLASPLALTNTYQITASGISAGLSGTLTTGVTSTNVITMAKMVDPATVIPGQVVTYTITLTNSGDGVADVSLSDLLHPAFTPSSYATSVMVPGRTWDTTAGVPAGIR